MHRQNNINDNIFFGRELSSSESMRQENQSLQPLFVEWPNAGIWIPISLIKDLSRAHLMFSAYQWPFQWLLALMRGLLIPQMESVFPSGTCFPQPSILGNPRTWWKTNKRILIILYVFMQMLETNLGIYIANKVFGEITMWKFYMFMLWW